jgi:hypothetical protein
VDGPKARRIVVLALAFGVAVDLLFDRTALGVNVPLTVAAAVGAVWILRSRQRSVDRLDLWIPAVTGLAALGVAARTDPAVVALDLGLAAAGLLAWSLAVSLGGLTRRSIAVLAWLAATGTLILGLGSTVVLTTAGSGGPVQRATAAWGRSLPVVRGLLLAFPVLFVFTALLASADIAFASLVEDLAELPFDIDDLTRHLTIAGAVAWVAGGGLLIAAAGLPWGLGDPGDLEPGADSHAGSRPGAPSAVPAAAAPAIGTSPAEASAWTRPAPIGAGRSGGRLGETEMLTILVAVEVLFAAFVGVQVAYLFGGFATVASFGITYSEYAREGFFQLVAVVAGAGILLSVASAVAGRSRWFVPAGVGLVALAAVILGSAALRLSLYQQAYGWTELRFYVASAIAWLALCLLIALTLVLLGRLRWLLHGVGFAAILVWLAVTAIGPQALITSQNVARVLDPSLVPPEGKDGLDAEYISTLGAGAVPILVDALPRVDPATRATLLRGLERQRQRLESDESSRPWPAWNLDRERARAALSTLPQ